MTLQVATCIAAGSSIVEAARGRTYLDPPVLVHKKVG